MKSNSEIHMTQKTATMGTPVAQVHAKFKEALALHTAGRLTQAQESYHQVLKLLPAHFETLYMLGTLAGQIENFSQSLEFIDRAIEINPNSAASYANRGNALSALKRYEVAVESYDKAIAIQPNNAVAYYNRGIALNESGQLQSAIDSYDKAIALKADYAQAYANRGFVLNELNQHQAAIESYDKAIAIAPDYAQAYTNRGVALSGLKQHEAAVDSHDKAIALKPDYAVAYLNRGLALYGLGQYQAAVDSHNEAIALDPKFTEAYSSRGNALTELKQFRAAIDSYDCAIATQPDFAEAYSNRGVALSHLRQHRAAIDSYDGAISIQPDFAEAYSNRGVALSQLRQYRAAIDSYDQAIAIKPDFAESYRNRSLCYLQLGDFDRGWLEYEWRWKCEETTSPGNAFNFSRPLWLGKESLQGKTILLCGEQGLGDTIQFCRYWKLVSDLGAHVILGVQKPLVGLLTHLEGAPELVAQGDKLPALDYYCPLLSLPLAFKTNLDNIPSSKAYIAANPDKIAQWSQKLGPTSKPRVGLVWSGSRRHKNDDNRSVALTDFLKRLPNGFQYVSLQKEVGAADHETMQAHPHILHFGEGLKDFTDTAALCELVDVVVSVDTSVAHLAGALGKPVWIVLPFNPDWRWMLDRNDSPWYPSAKLYQQEAIDDWDGVLERVSTDLKNLFTNDVP